MNDAIGAAESGLVRAGKWLDTTAVDIANAFTPRVVRAGNRSGPTIGVGDPVGRGYSNADLSVEMPNLLMAADDYETNLAVLARAQSAYRSVLELGRPRPGQI